jgi:hypothetical protein
MPRLGPIEDYLSWLIEIDRKTLALTGLDVRNLLVPIHNGEAMKEFSPISGCDFDFSLRNLNAGWLKRKLGSRYAKFLQLLGGGWKGYRHRTEQHQAATSFFQ